MRRNMRKGGVKARLTVTVDKGLLKSAKQKKPLKGNELEDGALNGEGR